MFESKINITESDSLHFVEAPFLNDTATQEYVETLQRFGDEGLSTVNSVSVDVSSSVVIFDDGIEHNNATVDENSPDGGLTTGSLIGIVVGSVIAFVACCLGVVWCILKRRKNESESNNDGTGSHFLPTIKESKRYDSEDSDDHSSISEDDDDESESTFDDDVDENGDEKDDDDNTEHSS